MRCSPWPAGSGSGSSPKTEQPHVLAPPPNGSPPPDDRPPRRVPLNRLWYELPDESRREILRLLSRVAAQSLAPPHVEEAADEPR